MGKPYFDAPRFRSGVEFLTVVAMLQYLPSSAHNSPYWTTNSGAPVWNNNSSVTVGARGAPSRLSLSKRAPAYIKPFYE